MAPEAQVTWVADRRFVGHGGSGHGVIVDGSAVKLGPGPLELVLIGLLGCTGYDVLDILEKKKQPVTGLRVTVQTERATEVPRVFTALHIEYVVSGAGINPKAVQDAIRLSIERYCSISAMLKKTATIETSFRIEEPAEG